VLAAPYAEPALRRRQSSAMVMAWVSAHLINTGEYNALRARGLMYVPTRLVLLLSLTFRTVSMTAYELTFGQSTTRAPRSRIKPHPSLRPLSFLAEA
jgi:hypothetical protein